MTQKSIKEGAIADYLAKNPLENDQPTTSEFPDGGVFVIVEEEMEEEDAWKMYFDGAANMNGCGIGAVVVAPTGKQYPVSVKLDFECTNNIAEYEACANGLKVAIDLGIKELKVFGDSALIIYQVNGEWRTKDPKLVPYQKYLSRLIEHFDDISFSHLTRDKNQFADALATLAVMTKLEVHANVQPIHVEVQDEPVYCGSVEIEQDGQPWYHDIKQYVQKGEYPVRANEVQKKTI